MNYLILTDEDGGTAHLTTDSPASKNGIPVLRIAAADVRGDFTAKNYILNPENPTDMSLMTPVADVIAWWLLSPGRTPEEMSAGELFLSELPDYDYRQSPAARALAAEGLLETP